ncbi:MAG: mannose-6-phosphate isomerase, class I [Vibrio metschnikovii]|uniref:mannose-6-phosphate isomerase, class I n=1 Tax=Vibrio metschnikovii TaxID=28172 RepID=UPI0001B95584|nr:mannose-6-phosphate isomerase, class I [Vibrio metschnikovii]EEX35718.1 mannose-6-phosphate isomerase [Vibrio metschnikovii CIP 69.14]EKO3566084.1 mannose-6-phosphate isomerase, class I [Vibrio metschnikovii]EKO3770728.1 mannose-6-phosphate isomerase, class I [Vibrio metschnikovii]MDM7486394.1 mannose-6-phosphate isomerase, class I [Vibrio metschnikovii]SUP07918.1 mannose-6-phosphate isomerase [Vibrio metschnikovii]
MSDIKTKPFFLMSNTIQNYAWGSIDSFSQLFDIANPQQQPQAELWMGAHPNGCSQVDYQGQKIRLSDLIASDPAHFLSANTAQTFGELPYLFKILAAEQALSIQVHPSKSEAEQGFAKENAAQIPLTAANRNYKDPNHKPELVYALTDYQAMNGFRPINEIVEHFQRLAIVPLQPLLEHLQQQQTEVGLKSFFTELLSFSGSEKQVAIEQLIAYAHRHQEQALFQLILTLAETYPHDIGLFAPLILNVLTLKPGQAMYLDARTPHAYLKGTGLEIMANSDNVLRAGLTPKHIDITELAKCTRFAEKPASTLLLTPKITDDALLFPVPVTDFKFAIYPQPKQCRVNVSSAQILLAIDHDATLTAADGQTVTIHKGESVFIPAHTEHYQLSSLGRVAKAYN